tara:strand:- start:36 stop:674 length:639 start_codon:yes stop_codon:yes gene_type:complete
MIKKVYGSLNKDKEVLYLINHKAANTTIVNILLNHGFTSRICHEVDIKKLNYIFTFVRNPYERLVSRYVHMKSFFLKGRDAPKTLNIGSSILPSLNKYFKHYNIKFCQDNFDFSRFVGFAEKFEDDHWEPQLNKFENQISSLRYMDFIGKVENLQEDFNILCDKIKIPQQELPHKNKSNHKHYAQYYDGETFTIVTKKYARDIEYFGYEFGK